MVMSLLICRKESVKDVHEAKRTAVQCAVTPTWIYLKDIIQQKLCCLQS